MLSLVTKFLKKVFYKNLFILIEISLWIDKNKSMLIATSITLSLDIGIHKINHQGENLSFLLNVYNDLDVIFYKSFLLCDKILCWEKVIHCKNTHSHTQMLKGECSWGINVTMPRLPSQKSLNIPFGIFHSCSLIWSSIVVLFLLQLIHILLKSSVFIPRSKRKMVEVEGAASH